ncbi:MAG: glycine-rich domain-containing protein [Candidatus Omnitrophota bacterium]|jgi:hypothetical protein
MKKIYKIIFVLFLMWTMSYGSLVAHAEVPHLINYQGRLTDTGGVPLNGSYNLTFRIYNAETAGNLLWEETQTGIVINKGIFAVLLGSVTTFNIAFDKPYFLEIKVGNEVMTPRQRMASTAYAMNAETAEKIKASDSDAAPGALTAKVKKSIVVDGNQLQLSGDASSPGNDKVYGTNSSGVKGWYDSPSQGMQVFTSSGTWVKPAGVSKVYVKVWGAGGGGSTGLSSTTIGGGGGGAGGYSEGLVTVVGDVSVIVGTGGVGGRIRDGNSNGANGSSSSFGSFITANGGAGAIYTNYKSPGAGGAGGSASGGAFNIAGGGGENGVAHTIVDKTTISGYPGKGGVSGSKLGSYGQGGGGGSGDAGGNNPGPGDPGQNGLVVISW